MNPETTTTASIDLAPFFFSGPTFHWPNVAVTLAEWQETDKNHSAGMAGEFPDTREVFWLRYKDIELFFGLRDRSTVGWNQPESSDFSMKSPAILPKHPVQLLQFLELTTHPEARDIAQFWLNLQNFLPFLSRFEKNVVWP
jgi:hypothetical protein